jgi:MFS family permease
MSTQLQEPIVPLAQRREVAWRWVHVGIAALAMVATLPGRTHGLGIFTEPILHSLQLDRESYGFLNLWATLLGALFCLPCGWLIDRFGTRPVLSGVMGALGVVVLAMSQVKGSWTVPVRFHLPFSAQATSEFSVVFVVDLFIFLLLTRGLGQSALSVASLSLIARSAGQRTGLAMGVYAFLTSLGFAAAFDVLRRVVGAHPDDWRAQWAGIGCAVVGAAVVCALFICNSALDADAGTARSSSASVPDAGLSRTLGEALRSPAFWTFSICTSYYALVSSGISLYNESILAERGFSKVTFMKILELGVPVGLASNLFCGWVATRWPLERLLALAMGLLGATLLAFPLVEGEVQVYLYAAALAAAGGAITVCFFTVWRRGYGPAHVGQIQGAAQLMTVAFSALGPQLFASTQARFDYYLPLFRVLGVIALALACMAYLARLPVRKEYGPS